MVTCCRRSASSLRTSSRNSALSSFWLRATARRSGSVFSIGDSFSRFSVVFSSGDISIESSLVCGLMTKVISRTQKAQLLLHGRELGLANGVIFFFEREFKDPLEPVDVDEFERKRPLTGGIDSLGSVSFREPQQLLCLAQVAPGELTSQQSVGELAGRGTDLTRFLPVEIGVPHRVLCTFFRIVLVIGRASSAALLGVGLDQLSTEVNPDHRAVGTHVDVFPYVLCWDGIQSRVETDVMVRVNRTTAPPRYDEPLRTKRNERRLFFGFKHLQRHAASRAMEAAPGGVAAPIQRSTPDVFQVNETLSSEEALPDEADVAFHDGLVFGMVWTCRVGEKATEGGIFQERAVKTRGIGIGQI